MNNPRLIIAAPKSGSGKTLITCSLLMALKNRGLKVGAFKSGPDYIDPMFHKKIIEIPSKNLDLFFTSEEITRKIFLDGNDYDISVIEGAMGLYDGLGGISQKASAYELAMCLKAPVILVIDARGMGRSILAEIKGFLSMDTEHLIKGVILNKITGMFYKTIKPVIEDELGIKVYGYYELQKELNWESRYLGLVQPFEIKDIKEQVGNAAVELEKSVEVDELINLANDVALINTDRNDYNIKSTYNIEETGSNISVDHICEKVRIAVAYDEAFCFYYEDNLKLLERLGAEITLFSPIKDTKLPEGVSGLILGGGYPELWADDLSKNKVMKDSIAAALNSGMPVLAECGGFMYLHKNIITKEENAYPMVGFIDGDCRYMGKLVRFGYVDVVSKKDDISIKAHEFHYFDSDLNGNDCVATKPLNGRNWDCIHVNGGSWMGFPHLYYPSNPEFVLRFIDYCKKFR